MTDLWIAAAIIFTFSVAFGFAGFRFARKAHRRLTRFAVLTVVILIILYATLLWNTPALVSVVPSSNAIVLGNWFPVAAALISGLYLGRFHGRHRRTKWFLVPLLCLVTVWSAADLVIGEPPACQDQWEADACLQSSPVSCSAAAAAMLLKLHDIEATESEMAQLCLTQSTGTHWLGLYRGLVLKTKGSLYRVEVFNCDVDQLRSHSSTAAILFMGLDKDSILSEIYSAKGWIPGVEHSVLLIGMSHRRWNIVDPAVGHELWAERDLPMLWKGRGIRLVRRH